MPKPKSRFGDFFSSSPSSTHCVGADTTAPPSRRQRRGGRRRRRHATSKVTLDVTSFSKYAGFTGVRLGWTVIPKELHFSDGFPVAKDFNRIVCTSFNGASNVAQAGGLTCLSSDGLKAIQDVVGFHQENANMLVETFTSLGFNVYGRRNAPYIWVHFPGRSSWDVFNEILEKIHLVTVPGSDFGHGGEDFISGNAFGHRENVLKVFRRLKQLFK